MAKVYWSSHIIASLHHSHHPLQQVVDVHEGAGLVAVAVDGQRLAFQGLHDEVGDDPAVIHSHPRTIRVEDADDFDLHAMLPVVVYAEALGATLTLVVT